MDPVALIGVWGTQYWFLQGLGFIFGLKMLVYNTTSISCHSLLLDEFWYLHTTSFGDNYHPHSKVRLLTSSLARVWEEVWPCQLPPHKNLDASCMLRYFLSGFQMGYDMGLGGRSPAGYYLACDTPKLFKFDNLALLCCFFFGIIYMPMYSTCLPTNLP